MKNVTSTEKLTFFMIFLTILVFVACFFLFRDIKQRSNRISAMTNELDQNSARETLFLSMKDVISNTKEDRATIDSFFVQNEGSVDFIELVEEQGKKSEVETKIIAVSTRDAVASSTVEVLSLEVEVEAKWPNIYRFLSLLENLPYSIKFGNVLIRKQEEGEKKSLNWKASLILEVLKLKSTS